MDPIDQGGYAAPGPELRRQAENSRGAGDRAGQRGADISRASDDTASHGGSGAAPDLLITAPPSGHHHVGTGRRHATVTTKVGAARA